MFTLTTLNVKEIQVYLTEELVNINKSLQETQTKILSNKFKIKNFIKKM